MGAELLLQPLCERVMVSVDTLQLPVIDSVTYCIVGDAVVPLYRVIVAVTV